MILLNIFKVEDIKMAFEPNYEKLVASFRKNLAVNQAKVEVKLATIEGEEVKSILCSSAKVHISQAEQNGNTINYSGEVNFQVIYESTMGNIEGLDYTAEFSDKYMADSVESVTVPIVDSTVIDVDVSVLNPTTLSAVAIVESKIEGIVNDSTQVLVGVNSDNVYTNSESITYYNYLGKLFERYDFTQDIEIMDSVAKVLSVTPSVMIDTVKPANDFVSVSGNVFVDMCYLTNEENPTVRSHTTTVDFGMEVQLMGVNENSYVLSTAYINTTDIKVTTNIEENKAIVNLLLPIVYNGTVFNKNNVENIVDLYSTTNELNVVSSSIESIVPCDAVSTMEKINGSVMVEDSFVDEVLGNCCNYVSVTATYIDEDAVVVEGVASTTVLYYNKEENSKNSIIVEMPFASRVKVDRLKGDPVVVANSVMSDISTKSKRGQEIEVFAKLYLYVDIYCKETSAVISEVTVGEEKLQSDCAIKIHIVRENETLWDIAKELGTSVDELMSQNENLELPLKENDRVFLYNQRVMEF